MPITKPSQTKYSEQNVLNNSYDEEFDVSVNENLVYNPDTQSLDRMTQPVTSELISTLQELISRLAPLAGAMSNTAQLRAVVTGAVTATGGGYITSAQHIANTLVQTNTLRYDFNNTLAIQSNINNCVVT